MTNTKELQEFLSQELVNETLQVIRNLNYYEWLVKYESNGRSKSEMRKVLIINLN